MLLILQGVHCLLLYRRVVVVQSLGNHPLVCRLLKGCFEQRPALSRYTETWDVDIVLGYLDSLPQIQELSLRQLTLRTVMLLPLLTGQRGHALHLHKVKNIKLSDDKCVIVFSDIHKHTKPGSHSEPAVIKAYTENTKLCLASHLRAYIDRTVQVRKGPELFVSIVKPHVPVSRLRGFFFSLGENHIVRSWN